MPSPVRGVTPLGEESVYCRHTTPLRAKGTNNGGKGVGKDQG